MSMVEMATAEVARQGGSQVNALHLKLGQLSGVVKEALLFSWEVASAGSPLAGSRLLIEEIPVVVRCANCESDRTLPSIQQFFCPVCRMPAFEVLSGRELEVVALEIQ
jgi:hydrogenase nickel incorporation protein HypA/HybF